MSKGAHNLRIHEHACTTQLKHENIYTQVHCIQRSLDGEAGARGGHRATAAATVAAAATLAAESAPAPDEAERGTMQAAAPDREGAASSSGSNSSCYRGVQVATIDSFQVG